MLTFSYSPATPTDNLYVQALDRRRYNEEAGKFDRLLPELEKIAVNRPNLTVIIPPAGRFYQTLADIRSLRCHVKELKGIHVTYEAGKILVTA